MRAIVAITLAVLAIILYLRWRVSTPVAPATNLASPNRPLTVSNSLVSRALPAAAVVTNAARSANLAIEQSGLSDHSRQVIAESLRTFQELEIERRRATGNGARLLEGLQRKLLMDDYTYALLLSQMDCAKAAEVHSNLFQQVQKIETQQLQEAIAQ